MNGRGTTSKLGNEEAVVSESLVKVRYAETDQMGVAYYANYLVWFEVGRSQYCNDRGFSYRDLERETGLYMMVAEAKCRYVTPARYEDDLAVKTRVTQITRLTIRFGYLIERVSDGAKVATGETLHVVATPEGRVASFPKKFRDLLEAAQSGKPTGKRG
jgi:acyl-CoA thioester hydrolase